MFPTYVRRRSLILGMGYADTAQLSFPARKTRLPPPSGAKQSSYMHQVLFISPTRRRVSPESGSPTEIRGAWQSQISGDIRSRGRTSALSLLLFLLLVCISSCPLAASRFHRFFASELSHGVNTAALFPRTPPPVPAAYMYPPRHRAWGFSTATTHRDAGDCRAPS